MRAHAHGAEFSDAFHARTAHSLLLPLSWLAACQVPAYPAWLLAAARGMLSAPQSVFGYSYAKDHYILIIFIIERRCPIHLLLRVVEESAHT